MRFMHTWTGNWENAFHGLRHPYESYNKSDSEFGLCDEYGDETSTVEYNWMKHEYPELVKKWENSMSDEEEQEYIDKIENISKWLWQNGIIKGNKYNDICEYAFIGPNDIELAQRMIKAGSPNDKFLRQIFVSVDITAPLYWWKEMDTYKVGTTANSTSTMHKLASTPITVDCFEMDDFNNGLIIEDDNNPTFIVTIDQRAGVFLDALEKLRLKYNETKDIRYWKELIRWLPESWLQTRTFTCNYAVLRNIIHWRKGHKLTEWQAFLDWTATLPYAKELLFFAN